MPESIGQRATRGALWASLDRFGVMGLQFVVNLILARLLLPADFGIIGMLAIFIAVSQTLIDGGFGSALIQKKNPTQTDYSTIFYWNVLFSIGLYAVLFFLSPLVARFFSMPLLSSVLRVIALNLIVTAVLAIQKTRLQKSLAFKTIACVNIFSYILGSVLAVLTAYQGWGVWSLVLMQLTYGTASVLIIWIITRWTPSVCFSKGALKELFGFGGFIMAANILQTICQNLQGIIIGKRFSATQMGYFSQAYKLDQITSYSIPQVIVQVMYPVYSSLQDDKEKLNDMVLMNLRVVSFIVFPILSLLILVAEPLITLLYGETWLPSVPYFRILCVGGFFVCLQNINYYAVAAVGKSKTLFKWSFYKWGFLLTVLLIGMNFGMRGILWGMVLSNINIFLINAFIVSVHTHLKMIRQITSVLPLLLTILFCMVIAYSLIIFKLGIIVVVSSYICLFFLICFCLRLKALKDFQYILNSLKI